MPYKQGWETLVILQLICCTITGMLGLHIAMASLQVRWKVRRYETSRWLLCGSMAVFCIHYFLQMTQGFRAQGADVGAVVNIMFYTPVVFAITLSIINMESTRSVMRRYCLRSAAAYALIVAIFIFGVFSNKSLHLGGLLYVMLAFFVGSMAYFIYASYSEVLKRKKKLLEESAGDLLPHVRYARSSLVLVCVSAAFLPIAILFNTLLLVVGPLMLLVLIFFVHSFISLGYYITPVENMLEEQEEQEEQEKTADQTAYGAQLDSGDDGQTELSISSSERMKKIEAALEKWCDDRMYKDCNVTIYSLAANLGCKKNELTEYFNLSQHTNFRTWLSDIRFNEAVRMMKENPEFSNDAISTECGFSSHTQIYRIFKQKTGLSPSQWREQMI
ncbi:helix-turn-helix domain-containing protein [Prevotella sp. AM42-24]|uniref:helix-turn-helix domain-containing protein n=1 Tax=Prevotella sp. AM42-24 TaxID=2293125 RepID=UPI001F40A19B|nr:helix-turn-helix domain-containing protein [Prevotella sp. AM42-24]